MTEYPVIGNLVREEPFIQIFLALVWAGNGAKLSSAGLWLNCSKPESVLETTMYHICPHVRCTTSRPWPFPVESVPAASAVSPPLSLSYS